MCGDHPATLRDAGQGRPRIQVNVQIVSTYDHITMICSGGRCRNQGQCMSGCRRRDERRPLRYGRMVIWEVNHNSNPRCFVVEPTASFASLAGSRRSWLRSKVDSRSYEVGKAVHRTTTSCELGFAKRSIQRNSLLIEVRPRVDGISDFVKAGIFL
jgi:hypothetical protein